MTDSSMLPPSLASTTLACPTCANIYRNKKELIHHLRTSTDELHKIFRYDASKPDIEPSLLVLGILPCPRGCGAFFDRGTTCTSRPLVRHIEQGKCRARNHGAAPFPREIYGPFMPTTTTGVTPALVSEARHAATDLASAHMNSAAIAFCLANTEFTSFHMWTSGLESAAALPTPL